MRKGRAFRAGHAGEVSELTNPVPLVGRWPPGRIRQEGLAMPLRDHFRPPLTQRHSWDELHGGWPMKIVESLLPNLPPNFVAAPQIHLGGGVEIDVATFDNERPETFASATNGETGGPAVAVWEATEPTLRVETDLPEPDEYEVRVYDVSRGRR